MHPDRSHPVARVALGGDGAAVGRAREPRPAGAAVELGLGAEELGAAAGAEEAAGLVVVPERAGEGALGALLTENAVLLGRQLAAPLLVGLLYALVHGAGIVIPIAQGGRPPFERVPRRPEGDAARRSASSEPGELVADAPGDGEGLTEG